MSGTVTRQQALAVAGRLLQDEPGNQEYERAVGELIADLWPEQSPATDGLHRGFAVADEARAAREAQS